ncbi:MAG: hypothetical protein J6126_00380 [Clostridia bacterium]|nr:hypothetical protein [Clostridia bacterium]
MPIVSIVLFIVAGALLLYAAEAAISKKLIVPINRSASVKDLSKDYVVRVAKLIALMSAAPAIGGIVGLFVPVVIIPIIVFAVLFIAIMIVGVKLIINKKDEEK